MLLGVIWESKIPHCMDYYDYRIIIKELAEQFEEQFTLLGENTVKCITYSVPIEKEVKK